MNFSSLLDTINSAHIRLQESASALSYRNLKLFRQFYLTYPQDDEYDPVGILLCTEKGKKLVEYALSGMDEKLFVSKYLLQLPSKKQLTDFIQKELNRLL